MLSHLTWFESWRIFCLNNSIKLHQCVCRVHHAKCQAGWSTSWNQDCWEKYESPEICRWYHPYGRKRRRPKELLDEGKRGESQSSLKTQHSKSKILAYGSITSLQIDGETVRDFIFLGSKITADGDCSHEIKKCLLLGRKAMTKLDSVLKSRGITWPTNVHIVKAMIFPVVVYECDSWTIKKAEHWRTDAFKL